MHTADYIPHPDGEFFNWVNNFYDYTLAHFSAWQIPSPNDKFHTELLAFVAAYENAKAPNRGKADVLLKNETRAALVKVVRKYYNASLHFNDLVTDVDREKMGLTIPHSGHTPAPKPSSYPEADKVDLSILRQVTIHFRDQKSQHKAKPKGVHGCEIHWALLDAPPPHVETLVNATFDTHSPVTLVFDESQRGQKLYFCLRWVNTVGDKGPFGTISNTIVP
ncbi:MAG: hypothetical protein LBO00_09450 [Zoogloeaceae bacterium]|jgi:hypothetical protein|nr:hypothetical protein [Zoogloeaceae bacterium]